jgi:hypothetical protein
MGFEKFVHFAIHKYPVILSGGGVFVDSEYFFDRYQRGNRFLYRSFAAGKIKMQRLFPFGVVVFVQGVCPLVHDRVNDRLHPIFPQFLIPLAHQMVAVGGIGRGITLAADDPVTDDFVK